MTPGAIDPPLLGRLVRPADYVRVLATTMRLRSPHFAVHHLEGRPLPLKRPLTRAERDLRDHGSVQGSHAPVTASLSTELSTGAVPLAGADVEDSVVTASAGPELVPAEPVPRGPGPQRWLGLVVPKRHAKRAVTRTLVKRQIRTLAAACASQLAPGLWVVRQRSPFDPAQYPSAASDALKAAARDELRALFERAVRGERDKIRPRDPSAPPRGKKGRSSATAKAKPTSPASPPASAEGMPCAS